MPRRKRASKKLPIEDIILMFVHGDGVRTFVDWDPVYENEFLARASWQQYRAAAWAHPARGVGPPEAAAIYDGIGTELLDHRPDHPDGWTLAYVPGTRPWSLDEARQHLERDVASVEAFQRDKPTAAAEIAEELSEYVTNLQTLFNIAETVPDHHEAGRQWSTYEMHVRQQHRQGG
ncbi:MAG: hypothetical protein M3P01_04150 [Actinomycetota bacterium]|nr:hypothetical protein [Actinomycetota bacterium]